MSRLLASPSEFVSHTIKSAVGKLNDVEKEPSDTSSGFRCRQRNQARLRLLTPLGLPFRNRARLFCLTRSVKGV